MKDPNHFLCLLLWALLLLVWVAFVRGRDMLLSPEGAPLISVSPESVLITQTGAGGWQGHVVDLPFVVYAHRCFHDCISHLGHHLRCYCIAQLANRRAGHGRSVSRARRSVQVQAPCPLV